MILLVKGNGQGEKNQNKKKISINLDTTPVFYTDNILLSINSNGVVMDIVQRVGLSDQYRIVSRIGMSRDHAKKYVEKLGKLLVLSEGKSQTGEKIVN